jgi:WD40 repeat protein
LSVWGSDGRTLATGGGDGNLRFWDAATAEPRGQPIKAHQNGVKSVAFSSDGRTLATGGSDGKLRLWIAEFPEGEMESSIPDRKGKP